MAHHTHMPTTSCSWLLPSLCILFLGLLLRFPSLSVQGALNGLLLWFNIVLPTLAPFIICTQMIVALNGVNLLITPVSPLFKTLFGLNKSGAYVLLCGLLCGYPLGAKMCADFRQHGSLTDAQASYLLAICNHPSPMFLLGYVQQQLPLPVPPMLLAACLYLPILFIAPLAGHLYGISPNFRPEIPNSRPLLWQAKPSLEDTIASTCETMVIIGGYIMLFSILAAWIQNLSFLPPILQALLTGLAEITTGVNCLCSSLSPDKALLPTVCAVAFGGLSGIFQTKSVIKNSGLRLRHYIGWKIFHAFLSAVILGILAPLLLP